MSQAAGPLPRPGWYPDPHVPKQMRWWDGGSWTDDTYERTIPIEGVDVPSRQQRQQARAEQLRLPAVTTEDGVELASWGRRVGARLLDEVVVSVVGLLASLPWTASWWRDAWHVWESTAQQAAQSAGSSQALADRLSGQLTSLAADPRLAAVGVAQVVVALVYDLAFLLPLGATPGKLVAGLRVRPWRAGERLTPGVVVRRWFGGWDGLGSFPRIGWVYLLLDSTWPLFDRRRQALHDKLAGTCVVRHRSTRPARAEGGGEAGPVSPGPGAGPGAPSR